MFSSNYYQEMEVLQALMSFPRTETGKLIREALSLLESPSDPIREGRPFPPWTLLLPLKVLFPYMSLPLSSGDRESGLWHFSSFTLGSTYNNHLHLKIWILADLGEMAYGIIMYNIYVHYILHTAIDTEWYKGRPKSCLFSKEQFSSQTPRDAGDEEIKVKRRTHKFKIKDERGSSRSYREENKTCSYP